MSTKNEDVPGLDGIPLTIAAVGLAIAVKVSWDLVHPFAAIVVVVAFVALDKHRPRQNA